MRSIFTSGQHKINIVQIIQHLLSLFSFGVEMIWPLLHVDAFPNVNDPISLFRKYYTPHSFGNLFNDIGFDLILFIVMISCHSLVLAFTEDDPFLHRSKKIEQLGCTTASPAFSENFQCSRAAQ